MLCDYKITGNGGGRQYGNYYLHNLNDEYTGLQQITLGDVTYQFNSQQIYELLPDQPTDVCLQVQTIASADSEKYESFSVRVYDSITGEHSFDFGEAQPVKFVIDPISFKAG